MMQTEPRINSMSVLDAGGDAADIVASLTAPPDQEGMDIFLSEASRRFAEAFPPAAIDREKRTVTLLKVQDPSRAVTLLRMLMERVARLRMNNRLRDVGH